ncbi:MAG: bifunctional hydroxymethylpyrimidine kinase/phosphomethylpyrimidine kinase [Acidimicrobiaceae bacterium]|nr:bifunctional hydroxymethylpyrimidine kinase/phosphomethylpyrimidine kinase [Acidimicrobiaceae bacterium]MDE0494196.1 bifunctional hydroxymethylpyrimidine kinase/phosphomethylpyrimidine kinase [Acidimicrobiaceae bacterium]
MLLTIAASDPLGGAGVQADLATFSALGVHGASALTAVTAQSLTAVTASDPVQASLVAAQIDAAADHLGVDGAKTGLLRRREIVELVADRIERGVLPAVVVDPVMVDGRGTRFVSDDVEDAYRRRLFPLARAITPNRGEAELLAGTSLPSAEAVLDYAQTFRRLGADAVVVTGGAFEGDPDDAVITASGDAWIVRNTRIATDNVRGSGCTFSAALAANLALGRDLRAAVSAAGRFVRDAIGASAGWILDGPGPVSHAQAEQPGGSAA